MTPTAEKVVSSPLFTPKGFRFDRSEVAMAVGVVAILMVMVIPLPTMLLDMLSPSASPFALVLLLVSMYVMKPLDLSTFPSLLLVVTLFRLSLNICSTRLILLHGHEGTGAAGRVIMAFGGFVVGGNFVVGFIVFLILVLINFLVITKGAGRIAEVAARFTLDAMPGKQMSHRRRPERRHDRRARGPDPAGADGPGSRILRGHGRGQQIRQGRRHRGHRHHPDQYRRRPRHRRAAKRHERGRRGPDLHPPDGGRRPW
jgi:hypothetical protein